MDNHISADEYLDFLDWKKKVKSLENQYLETKALTQEKEYLRWKRANEIIDYDEQVLRRMFMLEKNLSRLEALIYEGKDEV